MSSYDFKKGLHRTVIILGMSAILIGVVLLTVSSQAFILGICFLGAGSLVVIAYFLVTVTNCVKKARLPEDEENQRETEARSSGNQPETNATQFEAPRYEDVVLCGTATVWAVTLGPPPDIEPPPYHSNLALRRGVPVGDLQLSNPTLLRISSDIHELKRCGYIVEETWPEPLTPPPAYNETVAEWEDVFEALPEEGETTVQP
ncbi:uncharacterized protein LOC135058278 [Pseudophryne corroboree]|uniref:uncharacterized protein LOC135058278 n=1 Tax=Pseudophryne corroboree TaxID=495146 RepID=UPI003081298E